jgi:hypothetical protein
MWALCCRSDEDLVDTLVSSAFTVLGAFRGGLLAQPDRLGIPATVEEIHRPS